MNAGFLNVVEIGQYFMTNDTWDLTQLHAVACREYTLPRDEDSSEPKGWIQGNTKIGPVLEVTTCCLQCKYGVEVKIESMNKDNSQSWVRISHGLNKLVTNFNNKDQDDSLTKSGNDTQPLRKRADFKQALSTLNVYTKKLEETNSSPFLTGSTNNGDQHRVLPQLGGMARILDFFLRIHRKSRRKKEASKGLWSIGATRCLQKCGENLRRIAFTNSFYFVTARSFTADGGLL